MAGGEWPTYRNVVVRVFVEKCLCENKLYTQHPNNWMVGVVVSSIAAISVFINIILSAIFYFTIWKQIKKHRDLMKLCRCEELTTAELERLIQLVNDKDVDINRRMRYDYAELGGAVTALELLFISNKSNDLSINCVQSFFNAQPALSFQNINRATNVLKKFPNLLNQEVILQMLETKSQYSYRYFSNLKL